jgi:hypothetical protein
LINFYQAKKWIIIIGIIFAVLVIAKIVLKDFNKDKLRNTNKLINILFIISLVALIIIGVYTIYRYIPVNKYETDRTGWNLDMLQQWDNNENTTKDY